MQLSKLVKSRPWLFVHDIVDESKISETEDGSNLGYKYKYRVTGVKAVDVIEVNYEDSHTFRNIIPNTKQALRAGFSYYPRVDGIPGSREEKNFVFVNGIIHSDEEVTSAVIKKDIAGDNIQDTPESFQDYFAHVLAKIIASTTAQSVARSNELKDEILSKAIEAIRDEQSMTTNPHLNTIFNWIQSYYVNSFYFQNGSRRG